MMTNNVGMTMRQARPTYLSNGGLGGAFGNLASMFGNRNPLDATKNVMSTMPVGSPVPVPGGAMKSVMSGVTGLLNGNRSPLGNSPGNAMSTMPVGRPMPIPDNVMSTMPVGRPMPINVRNAAGGTPMNPSPTPGVAYSPLRSNVIRRMNINGR